MENVLLRKKTKKAKLGVGRYAELTVENVLANDPSYISWVYFCVRDITFTDDILDELKIDESLRIDKPGVSRTNYYKNKDAQRDNWIAESENEHQRMIRRMIVGRSIAKRRRIKFRREAILGERRNDRLQNRARLAWRNQGH